MSDPNSKEYYFKEGCYIEEWLNSTDEQAMSIARVRVAPNAQTRLHSLRATTERYAILSGQAIVTVAGKSWSVSVGDIVTIEPEQPQKISNQLNQDLLFLAICTPRFQEPNYRDLESD